MDLTGTYVMGSKGKCGNDVLHQIWEITSGMSIKVKRNIPKDKLTTLNRQYKNTQYPTMISYCYGCLAL